VGLRGDHARFRVDALYPTAGSCSRVFPHHNAMGRWISGGVTASLLRWSGDRWGADALLIGLKPVHERELFAIKAHEASPSQLDIIHEQG
jgi:hypothetical protein